MKRMLSTVITAAMALTISGCTSSASAAAAAGEVVWKNAAGQKIAIHTVDTFDASCPPQNPGSTSNFTLNAGESHSLKLVDGQRFCWTWRNDSDSDGSTDQINWCNSVAGAVIEVSASKAPASQCKEKIR